MTKDNQERQAVGRPSQFTQAKLEDLPVKITGFVLGDQVGKLRREEIAERVDECIVKNSRQSKRCQTNVAMALYLARVTCTFRDSGYRSWDEYIKAMVVRYQSFSSGRQADRYVHAVQTWLMDYGYDPGLLEKYGPSILGEIAQAGVVRSKQDAEAWVRLLESRTPVEVRKEYKEQRARLDAPEGGQSQLREFNPNTDDDDYEEDAPPPPVAAAPPSRQVPPPSGNQPAAMQFSAGDDGEGDPYGIGDEGITDAVPVIQMGHPVFPAAPPAPTAEPVTQVDHILVDIVESVEPGGKTFFTVYIRKNGQIAERYTCYSRPKVREMKDEDSSEVGRERRNLRVQDQLRSALGGGH